MGRPGCQGFFELLEENAGTGAHGWCAGATRRTQQVEGGWERSRILPGEFGDAMQRCGLDDGTSIIEPRLEHGSHPTAVGDGEFGPGDRQRQVPPHFGRLRFRKQPDQCILVRGHCAGKGTGWPAHDAFQYIGCAAGDSGVAVPEQFDQPRNAPRVVADPSRYFGNPADIKRRTADRELGAKVDVLSHRFPLCYEPGAAVSDLAATRPTPRSNALTGHIPSTSGKNISPLRLASGR